MPLSQDDQQAAGHLIELALVNFGTMSRDASHNKFCWFLDRAISFSRKRDTKPSQVIEPDAHAGGE